MDVIPPLVGVKIFFVAFCTRLLMIPDLVCLHYDMPHTNKPLIASSSKNNHYNANRILPVMSLSVFPDSVEIIAMTDPLSPLTPRNSNSNTPRTTVKNSSFKHSEKPIYSTYDEDIENLPTEDSIAWPSPSITVDPPSLSPLQKQSPQQQQSPTLPVLEQIATPLTEDALRENDGLPSAMSILGDTSNGSIEIDGDEGTPSPVGAPQGYPGMDDTNFTAFSAVPNVDMTLFGQTGQSPKKNPLNSPTKSPRQSQYGDARRTPRPNSRSTPASTINDSYADCSPSPSPRRPKSSYETDTTNLILDFTEQFNAVSSHSPYKRSHKTPKKSQTQPDLALYLSSRRAPSPTKQVPRPSTPTGPRHLASLLDFDLPPAPTPRSVPSITARELESLKSSFLSQICSLRATLSGKEAEVNSLKEAVGDAERRVGEALEEIRDLKGLNAELQAEKAAWESRDKERQSVLRKVKEEVIWADSERDQVQQKLDESEGRCLVAEARTVEVECQLAGLATFDTITASGEGNPDDPNNVNESVRTAVLKLAQDLHGLYKSKHELKIDSLKESYKRRYGRQIGTLETKLADISQENEDLRAGKDVTFSSVVPANLVPPAAEGRINSPPEPDQRAMEEERAIEAKRREEQDGRVHALEQELATTKRNNEALLTQLETERLGMAELVAATEEMMHLSEVGAVGVGEGGPASKSLESLRGSISRASSGLKAPNGGGMGLASGFGESRIGKVGAAGRSFGMMPPGGGGAGVGATRTGLKGRP